MSRGDPLCLRLARAACAALLLPVAARAGNSNYQDVLVGERAAGMGGAFTALADDASASYYNPAGLATIGSQNLSLSANVFDYRVQYLRDYFRGQDLRSSSVSFFPSDWYTVIHTTRATYAISVIVPENLSATASGNFSAPGIRLQFNANQSFQTYLIGPAVGLSLTPRLSVGAAAYLLYGRYSNSFHGTVSDPATGLITDEIFQQINGYQVGVLGLAGLKYRLSDRVRLGLVLRTGAQPHHVEDRLSVEYNPGRTGADDRGLTYYSRIPWSTTLGVAYLPDPAWTLAADLSVYAAARTSQYGMEYTNKTICNLNLGAEYTATPSVPLRFGFFTNRSAAPGPADGTQAQPPHVDQYGVTASVGLVKGAVSTACGVKLAAGWGQANSIEGHVINDTTQEAALFLGGTFRF
ncbi:MAG: outer membrane protein transport protein [Elusimicrobia bacterium]|nr:outer membrane protein transport protein [Elusimicrobiota bacterium]